MVVFAVFVFPGASEPLDYIAIDPGQCPLGLEFALEIYGEGQFLADPPGQIESGNMLVERRFPASVSIPGIPVLQFGIQFSFQHVAIKPHAQYSSGQVRCFDPNGRQ
jgi:hypothetical protein